MSRSRPRLPRTAVTLGLALLALAGCRAAPDTPLTAAAAVGRTREALAAGATR